MGKKITLIILCFVGRASLYNPVNKANLVYNVPYYVYFFSLCVSGDYVPIIRGKKPVSMRHLVLVILCGWLPGMQENMLLHTRQSSTENDKYELSHRYSYFSRWWAHNRPKHIKLNFDVLLTVYLSVFISVINQLDAQNFCFIISFFHASTCFEYMCSSTGGQNCITQPLVSSHL